MDTMTSMEAPAFRNRSASIAALAAALAAAQKNFASIPKDREVTVTSDRGNYKFKYATLDAILSATMPALTEQGLALTQALTDWGNNYAIETTLYHSSGEWISNVTPMFLSGRRTKDGRDLPPGNQEFGSGQSYARRYGASALLCITADEDDDANHADGNHAEGQRIPYKPAPGTAGAGKQFRPERRSPGMAQTESLRVDPADRAMVQGDGRSQYEADKDKKATTPVKTAAEAGNAVKRIEWTRSAIAFLNETNEPAAREWREENENRITVIEGALPTLWQELMDAYDRAIERKVAV